MQREDEPLLREAAQQADNAGREGEGSGERDAPVSEARGHRRSSLLGIVCFLVPLILRG